MFPPHAGYVDVADVLADNEARADFFDDECGWSIFHYSALSPTSRSLQWAAKKQQLDPLIADYHGRTLAHMGMHIFIHVR